MFVLLCESLSVVCFGRQTRRKTPPPMSDHILHTKSGRECDALPQKTTGSVGHSSVGTRWPYVVVVVVVKHSEA